MSAIYKDLKNKIIFIIIETQDLGLTITERVIAFK